MPFAAEYSRRLPQLLRDLLCRTTLAWLASSLTSVCAATESASQDFTRLDLATLMNVDVTVTSVSKREEKLNDAASAITVLSNEDLRRSGATSIAEALRQVPGMDVAQINSSTWAVSARGFDEVFSRSLLVLVDGRAVFSPFNGSVYWDLQQQMLEDIDRIEVIRGPGGTLWGANAVNGVVNIVTKSARDTQGALLYGGGGDVQYTQDGIRYGGKLDADTAYRVFGSFQSDDHFVAPDGTAAADHWHSVTTGFRIDRYSEADVHATWQGDYTRNQVFDDSQLHSDLNTLGRWTRTLSEHSNLEFQAYVDHLQIDNPDTYDITIDSLDLSAQHTFRIGDRNDVIWGLGARLNLVIINPGVDPTQVRDGNFTVQLYSVFLQDEFKIVPDKLTVTAGTKIDHASLTGIEVQPNLRAMFKPTTDQTVWAAVSRAVIEPTYKQAIDAVRTPGGPTSDNVYPSFIGNTSIDSSIEVSYEVGYRIRPIPRVSVELAGYVSHYSKLINQVDTGTLLPFPLGQIDIVRWENSYDAHTHGGEANITFTPLATWRLSASYSVMSVSASGFLVDGDALDGSPAKQFGLRSSNDFTQRLSMDVQLRHVDPVAGADAYFTGDLRVSYRPLENLELSLVGQNLFQPEHFELSTGQALNAQVPRGIFGKFVLRL